MEGAWRRKKRRREDVGVSCNDDGACSSLPAAPAMHLPPFILQRASRGETFRETQPLLAPFFINCSCYHIHASFPPPLRAACPTPLTYNAPQQPPPSLYLPSTALSHALPSLTLSCFLSLSTFLVNEVPISPPTTKLEKDLVLGTSCKRVLREICLARKASVYARWLK